jgi:hypothetical protein
MKILFTAIGFIGLLLFSTSNSKAAGITVSPGGSIQSAIGAAEPGDIITVSPGTYNERVNIAKTGITLKTNGKVIIKAVTVTGNNNKVSGFTITDPGANAGITVKGNINLFENNEIYHTAQDGVWFFGINNTFRSNYIHDILDPSISGDPHVDCFQTWGWNWDTYNILIERNLCNHTRTTGSNQSFMLSRNIESGQTVAKEVRDITLRNNIFIMHDAGYSPANFHTIFSSAPISNVYVYNNTFYNTTGAGESAVSMIGIINGKVFNNASIGFKAMTFTQGGNVGQGNNFTSGNYGMADYKNLNFHLNPESSLIDSGQNVGVNEDFDGNPRPVGEKVDIGAFEYTGASAKKGDVNGDGKVDIVDIGIVIDNYAKYPITNPKADVNGDGKVDIIDTGITIDNYTK